MAAKNGPGRIGARIRRIRGGLVWTIDGSRPVDIVIDEAGRISAIEERFEASRSSATDGDASEVDVIDASGLWVFPGAIDAHVHFRDPGLTEKEDFTTGSTAAAIGGVTTVLDMPNTIPPVSSGHVLRRKIEAVSHRSLIDYGLFGALVAEDDAEGENGRTAARAIETVEELIGAGAVGVKIFMGPTTGDIRSPDWGTLYEVLKHFSGSDVVFTFHCEDRTTIEVATSRLKSRESREYASLLQSRPRFGELMATEGALRLASETGARVHIAHVALKEAVVSIERAKDAGARVTAETCPQYLFLSENDYGRLGSSMKVLPPIRSLRDQRELWYGLEKGVIDFVATDHAPHERDGDDESPLAGPYGAAGVETMLPLMVDAALAGRCSPRDVVRWISTAPAKAYRLSGKGRVAVGADADFALIDPSASWKIDESTWRSKSNNTPFWGRRGEGKPTATIVRGRVVVEEGRVFTGAEGRRLP